MVNSKVERFFNRPTQVAFYDTEQDIYIGGIAHGNEIICLECGGTIKIDEYLDDIEKTCPAVQFPIIELSWWCNLSDECLGGTMFDAWTGEILTF